MKPDFPALTTPRLLLRAMTAEDIPALVKYANNPKIAERVLNIPYPYREHDAIFRMSKVLQGFNRNTHFSFAMILTAAQELVGEIGLYPMPENKQGQMAYWVAEPYWGRGLASEAVAAVLAFGFSALSLDLIFAECKRDNLGSIRVLEKNGMRAVGTGRSVEQYYLRNEEKQEPKT